MSKQLDFYNERANERRNSKSIGRIQTDDRKRNRYGMIDPLSKIDPLLDVVEKPIQSTWLQEQLGKKERSNSLAFAQRTRQPYGLGPSIEEEPRRNSTDSMRILSLSRTLSWPPHERSTSLLSQQADVAIYTCGILKKNRHGSFQKRMIRFDGTLLICFSAKKDVFRKFVSDVDILESPHKSVSVELKKYLNECYPSGTIQSLAQSILSSSTSFQPDPFTPKYLVPKWVIPVASIVAIESNIHPDFPESKESRTFTIKTTSSSYTFQLPSSSELLRFRYLLDSVCFSTTEEQRTSISGTIRVMEDQRLKLERYQLQQQSFKKVLHSVLLHDSNLKTRAMTLQTSGSGIKKLPGVVLQPMIPKPQRKDTYSRFSLQRKILEQEKEERNNGSLYELAYNDSLPLSAIERQIRELDEELAGLEPIPESSFR